MKTYSDWQNWFNTLFDINIDELLNVEPNLAWGLTMKQQVKYLTLKVEYVNHPQLPGILNAYCAKCLEENSRTKG